MDDVLGRIRCSSFGVNFLEINDNPGFIILNLSSTDRTLGRVGHCPSFDMSVEEHPS